MFHLKLITRIIIYFFVFFCIMLTCLFYSFSDINKLKSYVEKNLKDQLTCTVKLGELQWDWKGLEFGVTASDISLYDQGNNLVLQAGPTRFVWHFKSIVTGRYSHFYRIESANLYLNAIRNKKGIWNLIAMFPPGPPPKVDNLELHNSIIYLIDELNPDKNKTALYKDLNVNWEKRPFSKKRRIDLFTRIGSLTSPSFVKIKGFYTESKKFNWNKNELDISVLAKKIDLAGIRGYLIMFVKEPELKKLEGEFTGRIIARKTRHSKEIILRSITRTNNFRVEFQNKDISQVIEIPKTNFVLSAIINQNKITIKSFKSQIDKLSYELGGTIYNWSKTLPEVDVWLKTNKFNFKTIKPYLPLSLLPPSTRIRIEPLNDDGIVQLDLKLKGNQYTPVYNGTILLENFNLTSESGFLSAIHGLNGMLTLDNDVLKIDYLNIPIDKSLLILKGLVDSKNSKTTFTLNGHGLEIDILQELLLQSGFQSSFVNNVQSQGKLDLAVDVSVLKDSAPEIKGKLSFHNAGISIIQEEPLEIKDVFGELLLDGSNVIFNKLGGLINNEAFSINGGFSLKEDERVSLSLKADHLKIIRYLFSFLTAKTPVKPLAETISGEFSNLNLNIGGTFTKPILDGRVLISDVSFSLPNLTDRISNISGNLQFEGADLLIQQLSGKIQNSEFAIDGYIEDLFNKPKPKIRVVSGDVEISSFWEFIKKQLKTTSLEAQADALEQLKGIASVDLFIHPDAVLGNIFFKNGEIKYKLLPFGLNNLDGRLVIGEKNITIFGLMGSINDSNNFICDLNVTDYLSPSFSVLGMVNLELDLPAFLKAVNAPALDTVSVMGLIPTTLNFDFTEPVANVNFYSTLDETLELEFQPYIKKPLDKNYELSGNLEFDTMDLNLYLNDFNIKSNKLSFTTNGSIKNISSKNPELMLYFNTDEPAGIFMVIEPIIPLMGFKFWGMIDLNGSVAGTPSMYAVSSIGKITEIRMPDILGKKLTATDGDFNVYFDNNQGVVHSKINNVNFVSLKAKSVSLSGNYVNPIFYLNELTVDGDPGSIFAVASYDPRDNMVSLNANGSGLDLSSLGSFVLLDPSKISGTTDFSFMIDGKGKTKDEILDNSKGSLSFSVSDGKLGQIALLQKGLQLASLLGQGVFGLNLKNVFSLFFKYQDGSFNTIKGSLDLEKGFIKANEFLYRAKDLFLNSFGFIDLKNNFVGLSFYGYLPTRNDLIKQNKISSTNIFTGAISIIPDALGQKRFFIPFFSSTPPQYFKFEVKGDSKKPKKIMGHARRSFRWLKGKRLQKEIKFVPKVD